MPSILPDETNGRPPRIAILYAAIGGPSGDVASVGKTDKAPRDGNLYENSRGVCADGFLP